MRKILLLICLYAFFSSCNDIPTNQNEPPVDIISTVTVKVQPIVMDTNLAGAKNTIQVQQEDKDWTRKILGAWALNGSENATFVIEKKKISYPETFTSYKYSILKDSIRIIYDDYSENYLIKMYGSDTLILIGDEE